MTESYASSGTRLSPTHVHPSPQALAPPSSASKNRSAKKKGPGSARKALKRRVSHIPRLAPTTRRMSIMPSASSSSSSSSSQVLLPHPNIAQVGKAWVWTSFAKAGPETQPTVVQ